MAIFALIAIVMFALAGSYYAIKGSHAVSLYTTSLGQTESLRLPDGTRIQLNSNTKLRTDISKTLRMVTLDDGEAYFEVVHDPKRPFVVYAGNKRITDLGTKFSVFRTGDDVRVIVSEGKIQIDVIGAGGFRTPVVAEAGHVVVTKGGISQISEKPEREILNDLSWRSGFLILDQKTLAQAAAEFNRYNSRQLIIEGRARDMKIGGRFKANSVDSFITLLHQAFGLSIDDRGTTVIVSR